jgi:hypothetical protein
MNDLSNTTLFDDAEPIPAPKASPPPAPKPAAKQPVAQRKPELVEDDEPERWSPHDDTVIIHEQPAIRVYVNQYDEVTIMRKSVWDKDEDEAIYIRPENLPALIRALQKFLPR